MSSTGKDGIIISSSAGILSAFQALISQSRSTQTCPNKTAGTDLSRPIEVAKACPEAWEKMFPYYEETSGTQDSPVRCSTCPVGTATLVPGELGRIGL